LSYQAHDHRSENWVVVFGRATCIVDGETAITESAHSVDAPLGAKRRFANEGDEEPMIVEVQRGAYTGDDDILSRGGFGRG
jgi:mannose-6-phosphate isomerase-like protein (cupin superfamily)